MKDHTVTLKISASDLRNRLESYPLQPGLMKKVNYTTTPFFVKQVNPDRFLVLTESGPRYPIRAELSIHEKEQGSTVTVKKGIQGSALILPVAWFLFIVCMGVDGAKSTFGTVLLMFCSLIPLFALGISYSIGNRLFRKWLNDGLLKP